MHPANIFLPNFKVMEVLWLSSHWIWKQRATAKLIDFPFSEETITETVLLNLAIKLSDVMKVVPFNKVEEGKIGADWEWCLYDQATSRYLRFLVQAKALDVRDENYAHIDRCIGNTGVRQIDRLCETARQRGVPAIYAFYNHLSNPRRLPRGACACIRCRECWGASIASLPAVYSQLPDKSFEKFRQFSLPWHCLFCPKSNRGAANGDLIDCALLGLRRLYDRAPPHLKDTLTELPSPPSEPDRDPPPYLQLLHEAPHGEALEFERYRERMALSNPGVDGIVLINAAAHDKSD